MACPKRPLTLCLMPALYKTKFSFWCDIFSWAVKYLSFLSGRPGEPAFVSTVRTEQKAKIVRFLALESQLCVNMKNLGIEALTRSPLVFSLLG